MTSNVIAPPHRADHHPAMIDPSLPDRPRAIATADGLTLQATVFGEPATARASVVIASALGVQRRFYRAFAHALAARGFAVWTFDYRAIGDSPAAPTGPPHMRDWALDIDAVIEAAAAAAPGRKLLLVGHSCGGQLPGLAPGSEKLAGAVLVAATAPRADLYPLAHRIGLGLLWNVLIPWLSRGRDYLPARLMGPASSQFPAGVTREWARWARSRDYLFDPAHGLETSRYARLRLPILSLAFDDDRYAPPRAIEALLRHYPAAQIERRVLRAADTGGALGHFGFFRPRPGLWDATLDWMARQA